MSAKGVQASLNKDILNVDTYRKALEEKAFIKAQQAGFRMTNTLVEKGRFPYDNSVMTTYKGTKCGLNACNMLKRKLFENGLSEPHKRAFVVEPSPYINDPTPGVQ